MLCEGLYSLLSGSAELTAIIGNRITPAVLPKNPTFPAITFQQISDRTTVNLDGSATNVVRIEIDCWAQTYLAAAQAQKALHDLLDGYTGTLSDGTVVKYTGSMQGPDIFEHDSLLFRTSVDFFFTL
jgi:hypothetical protein